MKFSPSKRCCSWNHWGAGVPFWFIFSFSPFWAKLWWFFVSVMCFVGQRGYPNAPRILCSFDLRWSHRNRISSFPNWSKGRNLCNAARTWLHSLPTVLPPPGNGASKVGLGGISIYWFQYQYFKILNIQYRHIEIFNIDINIGYWNPIFNIGFQYPIVGIGPQYSISNIPFFFMLLLAPKAARPAPLFPKPPRSCSIALALARYDLLPPEDVLSNPFKWWKDHQRPRSFPLSC